MLISEVIIMTQLDVFSSLVPSLQYIGVCSLYRYTYIVEYIRVLPTLVGSGQPHTTQGKFTSTQAKNFA